MTLLRAALVGVAVVSAVACGTVDLEKDPLLRPPQLIDTDVDARKKTATAPTALHTALS